MQHMQECLGQRKLSGRFILFVLFSNGGYSAQQFTLVRLVQLVLHSIQESQPNKQASLLLGQAVPRSVSYHMDNWSKVHRDQSKRYADILHDALQQYLLWFLLFVVCSSMFPVSVSFILVPDLAVLCVLGLCLWRHPFFTSTIAFHQELAISFCDLPGSTKSSQTLPVAPRSTIEQPFGQSAAVLYSTNFWQQHNPD